METPPEAGNENQREENENEKRQRDENLESDAQEPECKRLKANNEQEVPEAESQAAVAETQIKDDTAATPMRECDSSEPPPAAVANEVADLQHPQHHHHAAPAASTFTTADLAPLIPCFQHVFTSVLQLVQKGNGASSVSATSTTAAVPATQPKVTHCWGKLLSNDPSNPHVSVKAHSVFTIGRSPKANLILDQTFNSLVCKLTQEAGNVYVEGCSSRGVLFVNGAHVGKGEKVVLKSGHSLVLDSTKAGGSRVYSYVFDSTPITRPASKPKTAVIQAPPKLGVPASGAGAAAKAILSSPATIDKNSSLARFVSNLKQQSQAEQPNVEQPAAGEETSAAEAKKPEEKIELEAQKLPPAKKQSILKVAPPPPAVPVDVDVQGTFFKKLLEKFIVSPQTLASEPENTDYISENTTSLLTAILYPYLKVPEEVSKLSLQGRGLPRSIKLEGPVGTELYQERLVRTLAGKMGAYFLPLDSIEITQEEVGSAKLGSRLAPLIKNFLADNKNKTKDFLGKPPTGSYLAAMTQQTDDIATHMEELLGLGKGEGGPKRAFRVGDRVRWTKDPKAVLANPSSARDALPGSMISLFSALEIPPPGGMSSRRKPFGAPKSAGVAASAGLPGVGSVMEGARGTVAVVYEDPKSKIGVHFDQKVPGGTDLGGRVSAGKGLFVERGELRMESESAWIDKVDSVTLRALFEGALGVEELPMTASHLMSAGANKRRKVTFGEGAGVSLSGETNALAQYEETISKMQEAIEQAREAGSADGGVNSESVVQARMEALTSLEKICETTQDDLGSLLASLTKKLADVEGAIATVAGAACVAGVENGSSVPIAEDVESSGIIHVDEAGVLVDMTVDEPSLVDTADKMQEEIAADETSELKEVEVEQSETMEDAPAVDVDKMQEVVTEESKGEKEQGEADIPDVVSSSVDGVVGESACASEAVAAASSKSQAKEAPAKKVVYRPCIIFMRSLETLQLNDGGRSNALLKQIVALPPNAPLVLICGSTSSQSLGASPYGPGYPSMFLSKLGGGGAPASALDIHLFPSSLLGTGGPGGRRSAALLRSGALAGGGSSGIFLTKIPLAAPKASRDLTRWKNMVADDAVRLMGESNAKNIRIAFTTSKIQTNLVDWSAIARLKGLSTQALPQTDLDLLVSIAASEELRQNAEQEKMHVEEEKETCEAGGSSVPTKKSLHISTESVATAVGMLAKSCEERELPEHAMMEMGTDNEFERRLLPDAVIPPSEIGVTFEEVQLVDSVKDTVRELVMLPLQRPELFKKGLLGSPCKGILLFGPAGTGKTMLAKAVATEAGAHFLHLTMSTIASKWFGEGEKYVKAAFSIASRLAPTVIFVDEVDAMLGRRDKQGEHEAARKIKNEFMTLWDGLRTNPLERVMVLGATNRPFDLDDAVLRRFSRRLLVDMPNASMREKVLKSLLREEGLPATFDYSAVARDEVTGGFSGADLRTLCLAAAYRPVRELLKSEASAKKLSDLELENTQNSTINSSDTVNKDASVSTDVVLENSNGAEESKSSEKVLGTEKDLGTEKVLGTVPIANECPLRPLRVNDLVEAAKEVGASISEDSLAMQEIRKWNEMFGDGGSRKADQKLFYYT